MKTITKENNPKTYFSEELAKKYRKDTKTNWAREAQDIRDYDFMNRKRNKERW